MPLPPIFQPPAPGAPAPGGPAAPGADPPPNPVDVTIETPATVGMAGDTPVIATQQGPQVQQELVQQVMQNLTHRMNLYMFTKGYGYLGPSLHRSLTQMFLWKGGFVMDLPQVDRADNFDMLPDAAKAALATVTTLPAASPMGIDPAKLSHELQVLNYRLKWLEALQWSTPMARLNVAQTEDKIAKMLREGVSKITGLLPGNSLLRGMLDKTLKWIKISADRALATRRDHEKLLGRGPLQQDPAPAGTTGTPNPAPGTGTPQGTVGVPVAQGSNGVHPVAQQQPPPAAPGHLPKRSRRKPTT